MSIIYSKESLIDSLRSIRSRGWIQSARKGNDGSIGNTLEDLLGITENNLPIPNAAEWELKCQRTQTTSLITLFHLEPSPTALKFVPQILLPLYGWKHKEAGKKYPLTEKSFRQTISAPTRTDRGFGVVVDRAEQKIRITFDASAVADRHAAWFMEVEKRAGIHDLNPQPYWGFSDLYHKAGTKLHNCFFVLADRKKQEGAEYFHYSTLMKLSGFSLERWIAAIEAGDVLVDFDARTGHNHGTKFRFRNSRLPELYDDVEVL